MIFFRSAFVGAALLIGATAVASAQTQYVMPPQLASNPYDQGSAAAPYVPGPGLPPAMSYNPYTSGLGPCPQRGGGDQPCSERIAPSYGQPDFWPGR